MIIDIIIIMIIALSTFLGYRKGFINLSVNLLASIIALLVMLFLTTPITNLLINTTSIDESIENIIIEKVNEAIGSQTNNNEIINELVISSTEGMLEENAAEISTTVIKFAVAILLFILVRVGLIFVSAIANLLAKIPVIKQMNEVGGIIYGLIRGVLAIYIILFLISSISLINTDNILNEKIEESTVTKLMYDNNIIDKFI